MLVIVHPLAKYAQVSDVVSGEGIGTLGRSDVIFNALFRAPPRRRGFAGVEPFPIVPNDRDESDDAHDWKRAAFQIQILNGGHWSLWLSRHLRGDNSCVQFPQPAPYQADFFSCGFFFGFSRARKRSMRPSTILRSRPQLFRLFLMILSAFPPPAGSGTISKSVA